MNLLKKKIFNVLILLFFVISCASDDGEKVTIEMIEKDYYKLNLQEESVTRETGFSIKIDQAYRKYQIKSLK